eukprot:gnl/TRDRNA2_/TRDRNA2_176493_c4_seq21.p1 gnl/TRDRNA2_/TRDRNA2_176493_c4~~gnl/TRDRNA2_/TRDRNA2_176493_c4_seq21.p1  ORF type:complete len:129 (-),score=7.41 gnl/TRDRNA2_/TRDRNA2_176493_c4_seq21:229-615(-)
MEEHAFKQANPGTSKLEPQGKNRCSYETALAIYKSNPSSHLVPAKGCPRYQGVAWIIPRQQKTNYELLHRISSNGFRSSLEALRPAFTKYIHGLCTAWQPAITWAEDVNQAGLTPLGLQRLTQTTKIW